jgi:putative addiction module component (TIGR02574 family)
MSTGLPDVFAAALALPEDARASLAFELLGSLRCPTVPSEDDAGFIDELDRRVDAYDRGECTASDWADVDRRMKQALQSRRSS